MTIPSPNFPRFLPSGEHGLLIELGQAITPEINQKTIALAQQLQNSSITGVMAIVPSYCSVFVEYDPLLLTLSALQQQVLLVLQAPLSHSLAQPRRWRVPVAYGGDYGIDLDEIADHHHISTDELIKRHCSKHYRVYMVGFMPGLAYLGELDPSLHTPRRNTPRLQTPAGSINIGGAQTLIASVSGPSGWHLLGRTPVRVFSPNRNPIFMLRPGDEVIFDPIAHRDFSRVEEALEQRYGMPLPELLS